MQAARVAAIALMVLVMNSNAWSAPVIKYVQSEDAPLRAGPASDFYVTQTLASGMKVEVYHVDGAWSAIRPPEGSFSWVKAGDIKLTPDPTVGIVLTDGVFTLVGSSESDQRDAEYVPLKAGELVELLGAESAMDELGDRQNWYKIAPPSGEFRWIRSDLLADRPVRRKDTRFHGRSSGEAASKPIRPRMIATSHEGSVPIQPAAMEQAESLVKLDPAATFAKAQPLDSIPTEPIPSVAASPEPIPPSKSIVQKHARSSRWSVRRDTRTQPTDADEPTLMPIKPRKVAEARHVKADVAAAADSDALDQIAELSIELSAVVTDDIANWELDFVRSETQFLLSQDLAPIARERATLLLDRIDRFSDVKLRYDHLQNVTLEAQPAPYIPPTTEVVQASPMPARRPPAMPRGRALQMLTRAVDKISRPVESATTGRIRQTSYSVPDVSDSVSAHDIYAGVGYLMPVYTSRNDIPRYALTDDSGAIIAFVSPQGGLNIGKYVRHQVGIMGRESRTSQSSTSHLLADRIVVLKRS